MDKNRYISNKNCSFKTSERCGNMKAQLILENGKRFSGNLFGSTQKVGGKIVFSTEMVAYQSVLTDSQYDGKMVVMTFPLIGNYGINSEDIGTNKVTPKAMIVREKCDFPSNFRMEMTLEDFFKQNEIVGLSGVDTRALAKQLRDKKEMKAVIISGDATDEEVRAFFKEVE